MALVEVRLEISRGGREGRGVLGLTGGEGQLKMLQCWSLE